MLLPNKLAQYNAYSQATRTVAKTKQVVMLYDGAIRYLQQAKEAITEKRIQDRYNLLMKASDVVLGLQGCIDFESGGEVAVTLFDFYSSIDARIISIHRSNDVTTCDQLIKELKDMRDVWQKIDITAAVDSAGAEAASNPAGGGTSNPPSGGVVVSA